MQRDPLQFEHETLPNGIEFYWNQRSGPVCSMQIIFPVGSGHTSSEGILPPGSPHFLEHCMFIQSKQHPEAHSMELDLSLRGCDRNGTTHILKTRYSMACPLDQLDYASERLFETAYQPVFTEKHLASERDVIRNERDQRKKFFPGRGRANQYMNQEFRQSSWVTLEQIFGSDEDLASFTPERMKKIHKLITSLPGTIVLAVGDSDFSALKEKMKTVTIEEHSLPTFITPATWKNPAFRYVELEDIQHPNYLNTWIKPPLSFEEYTALMFIFKYSVNHAHGALTNEFRKKRGWTYGIHYFDDSTHIETLYGFDFSLETKEQIEEVRKTHLEIVRESLLDQEKVEREIKRRFAFEAFSFQTADDIMGSARADILSGDKIRTNAEWKAAVSKMKDPVWRMEMFDKLFDKTSYGEIVLMPKP